MNFRVDTYARGRSCRIFVSEVITTDRKGEDRGLIQTYMFGLIHRA